MLPAAPAGEKTMRPVAIKKQGRTITPGLAAVKQ
jgi:hypothetical protein